MTMSEKKMNRYNAAAIKQLNHQNHSQNERECKECKRTDSLTKENICQICASLRNLSNAIAIKDYFAVTTTKSTDALMLPNDKYLFRVDEKELRELLRTESVIRFYGKNSMHTGLRLSAKLWMGDYSSGGTFEDLSKQAEGIKRIAVLRADVDNLGKAFVAGFKHTKYEEKYVTLSRTATLSRQLSLFFKYHINFILKNSSFKMKGESNSRNATVVYSGGDDMFIVGSWNDCVELALDINEAFAKYTQNTLTISAGIGMFRHNYPLSRMAYETGELEIKAKNASLEKNKIALFHEDHIFPWNTLKENVMNEKLKQVQAFFQSCDERGKAMIYKLAEYLRKIKDDKINIARLAYLLAKLEPDDNDKKSEYTAFTKQFYAWALKSDDSCRELLTALYLYIYLERERED